MALLGQKSELFYWDLKIGMQSTHLKEHTHLRERGTPCLLLQTTINYADECRTRALLSDLLVAISTGYHPIISQLVLSVKINAQMDIYIFRDMKVTKMPNTCLLKAAWVPVAQLKKERVFLENRAPDKFTKQK